MVVGGDGRTNCGGGGGGAGGAGGDGPAAELVDLVVLEFKYLQHLEILLPLVGWTASGPSGSYWFAGGGGGGGCQTATAGGGPKSSGGLYAGDGTSWRRKRGSREITKVEMELSK